MDKKITVQFNKGEMTARKPNVLDDALCSVLQSHQNGRFYGILHLHYEAGRLVRVRKEESVENKDILRLTAQ